MITRWNHDKPHRCPACHAIAISGERPTWWRVYTCCRCHVQFTRWPRLAPLLPQVGTRCEHRPTTEETD